MNHLSVQLMKPESCSRSQSGSVAHDVVCGHVIRRGIPDDQENLPHSRWKWHLCHSLKLVDGCAGGTVRTLDGVHVTTPTFSARNVDVRQGRGLSRRGD